MSRLPKERPYVKIGIIMDKLKKKETIEKFRRNEKDCGSCEVQIAVLTAEVEHLSEHLKAHVKDHHSRRGLLLKVEKRRKLQSYLKRTDPKGYAKLSESLGIK